MNILTAIIIAAAGGAARALVGSPNTDWWSSRGVLYPAWMLLTVCVLLLGGVPILLIPLLALLPPLPLWFPLDIRWEQSKKLALWWSAPAIASTLLLGLIAGDLFSPVLLCWPVAAFLTGLCYSQLKPFAAARGWSDQVPEAIAGAVVMGGAGLVLI